MKDNAHQPDVPEPGILLVLSAPSGAGKTTLAHRLLGELKTAQFSISYTTRPPRGSEVNGRDAAVVLPDERIEALRLLDGQPVLRVPAELLDDLWTDA